MKNFAVVILIFGLVFSLPARSTTFQTSLDEASWIVEPSIFICRLVHPIKDYGKAVYQQEAGESAKLWLQAKVPVFKSGTAVIRSREPVWRGGGDLQTLGSIKVRSGGDEIRLDSERSAWVLQQLGSGREVYFSRKLWFEGDEDGRKEVADVVLSPVQFQEGYEQMLSCLSELLPVNLQQIERSTVYFPPGPGARPSSKTLLKNIATYIKADPKIRSIYIDGHTDGEGDRKENFELSEQRANMVARQLESMGVSKDMFVVRWHGERYPVATNRTPEGRAKNRRVTVRLSMEPPIIPEPSEESAELVSQ